MAGEWTTFSLGDVCTKIGSGATPRGGSSVYLDYGDVTLIRSQNVYNDGFHHDGLVYLADMHAAQLANVEVQQHDVLLNITGDSVARACQVDPNVLPARVNQHVAIIRTNPQQLWPRYLRYFLVSPTMQAHMLQLAGAGATRNALTKGMIESFNIPAPRDVNEQKAIACILGALDDKIGLNHTMNRTLEATARAIFKSWFVDFDPVRAKAAGEQPTGLNAEIAVLFPDGFEQSDLGEIPIGWHNRVADELAGFVLGGDWGKDTPSSDFSDAAFCIRGADIPSLQSGGVGKMPIRYLKPSSVEKRSLRPNDIVVEISGGSPTQSTGRPVFISVPLLEQLPYPLVCSNFCRLYRPKVGLSQFVYLWLRWLYSGDQFLQYENGTTGIKNFAFTAFCQRHKVTVPTPEVLPVFNKIVAPLLESIGRRGSESAALAALRDALLPALVGGELAVADAERIVGRAI